MTTLEKFMIFAQNLPAKNLGDVESTLTQIMDSFSDDVVLSTAQEAEISRRLKNPNPTYATASELEKIWGKPFPT